MSPRHRMQLLTILLLTVLLLSACASPPPADPQHAERLRQEAQSLVLQDDYTTAARLYGEATRYAPDNADSWLQWGDLLEATDEIDQAAKVWSDALVALPRQDPLRPTISYRLGLLLAGPLRQPAAALALHARLPQGAQRSDLEAVLAMAGHRPAATLVLLKQALALATDQDQQARIYYHAAQAHAELGNFDDSRSMLFHAVNAATSPGTKMAIRTLYNELLDRSPRN